MQPQPQLRIPAIRHFCANHSSLKSPESPNKGKRPGLLRPPSQSIVHRVLQPTSLSSFHLDDRLARSNCSSMDHNTGLTILLHLAVRVAWVGIDLTIRVTSTFAARNPVLEMYIIRTVQDVPWHPWKPELRQAWYTSINPLDILYNRISARSSPCGRQVLCCLKKSGWRRCKCPRTFKRPSTSLPMIELNYTRFYTGRFADYHVTKANLPVISLHRYPACGSNKKTETDVRKGHSHSGNGHSCRIGSRYP